MTLWAGDAAAEPDIDDRPTPVEAEIEAPVEVDEPETAVEREEALEDDLEEVVDAPLADALDVRQCPKLFGDRDDRRWHRRLRKAEMLSVETRGHVVEITHGNRWRRPFYLELEGVDLLETEVDDRGRYTALLEVTNGKIDDVECADGIYRVDADAALGKQARVIDVLDGVMLVEYEGDLAYLMTAEAEAPTWQMVWRSGWYFVRQREVGSFAGKKRSRARKSRSRRNTRNRRNRNRRSRRR